MNRFSKRVNEVVAPGITPLPNSTNQLHGYRVVSAGMAEDHYVYLVEGDGVTEAGRQYALASMPPVPPPVKQTKYEEYLYADLGCSFAEWMGIEVPRREYDRSVFDSRRQRVRLVSSKATGPWGCNEEAKALYKTALTVPIRQPPSTTALP